MTPLTTPRTVDSVRQAAVDHLDRTAEYPYWQGYTPEQSRRQAELGKQLLEVILELEDGAVLPLSEWMAEHAKAEEDSRLVFSVMPFLAGGYLKLLSINFVHKECGEVPYDLVRKLIETESNAPVMHGGVELTQSSVFMEYRRLAI